MDGRELIGPVQWIVDVIKPLLTWTGVQGPWLQTAALNTIVLTTFIAKAFKMEGWWVMGVAGAWGCLYALAEYLPSALTVIGGTVAVFCMTALALKLAGLAGKGANKGAEKLGVPLGAGTRLIDK